MLSEGSWSTCEARHHEGLPALAVHWPNSKKEGFNLRHSLQILDTLLARDDEDRIVVVTEQKRDGGRSKGTVTI
jgi:hypothetical protein